jgi:general secretion pathway protein E
MRDMKVEPFLLASTLRAVIAQRLVRRLCPACRVPVEPDQSLAPLLGLPVTTTVYEARGCPECANTGYKGRIGVFEAVRIDDTIRRLINAGGDEAAIAAYAFRTAANLSASARALVAQGLTTAEEAIRVSRRESEPDVVDVPDG